MPEPTSGQQNPDPNQNPAQQQAANPPDQAAIEQAVLQKVFNGKYKTVDDAARGHWELNQHAANAMRLLEQRDNPATLAANRPDPLARLEKEAYIPPDAFRDAVLSVIGPAIETAFKPITGALSAREALSAELPAYITNETAIQGWLRSNPQVAAEVQEMNAAGLYKQAAKFATLQWQMANPPASPGSAEQKQQASLQTGNVNNSRTPDPAQNQDLLSLAVQYARRTGDTRPAYTNLFPDFEPIIPEHLKPQR